jgi:uncharacterized LabA/DUF88 family protein
MKVGVYVDGFNVYYGARGLCGQGTPGWRWLDLRSLTASILPGSWRAAGATVERLVYCTARVDGVEDPSSPTDQDAYVRALTVHGSVDHIEYGNFVRRAKVAPLATPAPGGPQVVTSRWPLMIKDSRRVDVPDARFMVSYLHTEEKGSDVNVAHHLLVDVLSGVVEAAVIVSNDSDLALPIRAVRERVPVGVVNPGGRYLAGRLRGTANSGAGNHWWGGLNAAAYRGNQLPNPVGPIHAPTGW